MMTSFTRIVIVLAILRQAIGLQTSPSNQVVIGIALFLTIFIMTPVFDDIYTQAIEPYVQEKIQAREAFEIAQKPLHKFMLNQTRMSDLNAFSEFANIKIDKIEDVPMRVVFPALSFNFSSFFVASLFACFSTSANFFICSWRKISVSSASRLNAPFSR